MVIDLQTKGCNFIIIINSIVKINIICYITQYIHILIYGIGLSQKHALKLQLATLYC